MDGRDCGPPRSVHLPPPLLTGLAMESHRLGAAAAAGRIPPSPGHLGAGHSASLHTGKYLSSAINIGSHHGNAFPVGSSPFLGGYMGSSNPHAGPAPMTSDPSFRAPNPTNLQMAQLWASHLHEGFSHLTGSLYPSPYIPLGHLEHPSSGSSLHAQFGSHPLYEPPKEGFYLPGHGGPSTLHSQSALSRTPAAHTPSTLSREREAPPHGRVTRDTTRDKDRLCRAELGEPRPHGLRDEDGPKEESRPRSVVDLTDDERRSNGPHRPSKKASPFISDPSPGPGGGELRPGIPLQTSSLSNCRNGSGAPPLRPPGLQQDGFPHSQSHEDENTRPSTLHHGERAKKFDPATTSSVSAQHPSRASPPPHGNLAHLPHRLVPAGAFPLPPLPSHLPPSLYPLYPTAKDPGREHRVIAPTFVPSVEVYEDRLGPAQITTQTRENKSSRKGEKDLNRQASGERIHMDLARLPAAHEPFTYNGKSTEALREEGSVIRSNCMPARRPTLSEAHTSRLGCSPDADSVLSSTTSKEPSKLALESENGSQDHDRIQRAPMRGGSKYAGVEPTWLHPEQPSPKGVISTEHKWKPLDMNKYASGQMSALVAQHAKAQRGEEDGKNAYLDHSGVHRPAPGGSSRGSPKELYPEPHREVSAMQSLIKYSGSFAKGPSSRPGSDSRSPFGGLGGMKLEGGQPRGPKTLHIPPHQSGKQLKRDPERPESAKSFGRESIGSQGEVEVRHPPVGIAVAVARQRENGSKPGLGLGDRERPLMGSIKGSGHMEEDRGDEGVREDRLLPGRLEREQEKLLRENKELADYTQMHLPEPSRLNPNLMVTGGPPLTSASRWPPDPASHVMSHPWLPRPSGPSMWTLSGSPYGLGPSSLHQGLPPGYPPALPGSIPPSYQFAQDPQSGQLVVIPTEHLPHYAAELMERSPPLWPGLYPGAGGASLHHAQELHLLSQQQLLRQQELLLIQQQAAQVMELQRSAQLAERLKESERRAEMEDKLAKRGADCGKQGISARAGSTLSSRKLPSRSPTPTPSYSKALTPLPSPVTSLKSECGPKAEKSLPEPSYSHPSTPAPRPVSPAPAPPAPVPPKEECVDVCESQEPDLQNHVSTPIRALYPEIPPGYPYESLPGPYGSHYPYLLQPAAAADADGLAPDVPLPAETPERAAASADVKPWRLRSPTAVESSSPLPREELRTPCTPEVKEEPGLEECRDGPESLVPRCGETTAPAVPAQGTRTGTEEELEAERCSAITPTPAGGEATETVASGGRVKLEETTPLSCPDSYPRAAADPVLPEAEFPVPEASTSPAALIYHPQTCLAEPHELDGRSRPLDPVTPQPEEADLVMGPEQPADGFSEGDEAPGETRSLLPQHRPSLSIADIVPDDPMAGMIALVTASELPRACPLTTFAGELPLGLAASELAGLEGMTLLGEMAELELQRRRSGVQPAGPCGLEALLMAGEQVLLEELHRPSVTIRLPRELNPNRKYSWMHKKEEEPLFCKSALEGMDIMEVEYRMRLAELQRRYKDRQRELAKLQRHREREEKQQQQQQQLEESSRAAARRGPGRPRKRRHSLATPSPPTGKPEARTARFSKSLPLSEDSEAGEVLKKRFRGPSLEEDEEMERAMKVKRKSKHWADGGASSSFPQEMQMKSGKKRRVSEQEQLATKLDQALSLTKLGKLHRAPFHFADGPCGRAASSSGNGGRLSGLREMELKARSGKRSLSKGLGLFQKSSKGGKNKMAAKSKNMESCLNMRGQQKALYSPLRSEVSSYSNNTDTEEEEEELTDVWPNPPALSATSARVQRPALCSKVSNKSWPPLKRGGESGSARLQQALGKKTHKHFGLSLTAAGDSSSEDSFDQDYFMENEDYEEEEEEEEDDDEEEEEDEYAGNDGLCSPSLEESGLGLLARFAASALPSPVGPAPLSVIQMEAKQKARKKEERQSLMGTEFEYTDSENDVKIRKKFPSLLHGKRAAPELPLLAPASAPREDPGPAPAPGPGRPRASEQGRKPKKTRPARALSLDAALEASDEDHWARRRSERIFLHDAAVASSSLSPTTPTSAQKSARCLKKDAAKPKETKDVSKKKKIKDGPASPPQISCPAPDSRPAPHCVPISPVRRGKAKAKPREVKKDARGKGGAVSKLMESMAADEDFEPNQDSSFSEDENIPLNGPQDRPSTPALRNCVIEKEELQDGLRVLIPMDDKLLYAGHVSTVHSPDIYRVMVEGERGNRPHIYCLEQLLQEAIVDVKPPSVKYLPEGTRIAAYWSQQYRCLYPGTVVRGNPDVEEDDELITVEFDDGDTGRIPLSHIRLLPPDYKIQCAEPSPALLVPSTKRRGRKSSKEAPESKEAAPQPAEEPTPKSRGRGRKPKPKPDSEVIPEEREKSEISAAAEAQEVPPPTSGTASRPGRKPRQEGDGTSSSGAVPNEAQKKPAPTKAATKANPLPQTTYTSALYGKVLSVNLYTDPCRSLGSFLSGAGSTLGKAKPAKKARKSEELHDTGVKVQRKPPQAEVLIKLDHEGVMSPKTKKTKALMMMEDQGLNKRQNTAVMGVAYTTVPSVEVAQKPVKTKAPKKENPKGGSVSTYRKLARDEEVAAPKVDKEELDSSSSSSSESEGEGQEPVKEEEAAQEDGTSGTSRASSPTSTNSSGSSSKSSSASSSSGSGSTSSSSSSSSSSSTTTDEDSPCSSDEETTSSTQKSSSSFTASSQSPPETDNKPSVPTEVPSPIPAKTQRRQPAKLTEQQSKSRPKRREGIHLPTTKELAKRQRLPSVENRPKISAFLPARQLWKWFGKPTQRRGMKGKAKKLFYKAIMRGKEMIRIGDCAVFLSAGRPNLPYIGHIQSMWESWGSNMVVRVKWFYHPEETNPGKKLHDGKAWDPKSAKGLHAALQASNQRKDFMERALYQSSHIDENDVQTISHKCLVVSLEQYEQMIKTKKYQDSEDLYYLAGTYEPTTGMIFNTDGVPIIC